MLKTVEKVLHLQDLEVFRWASTENLARLAVLSREREIPSESVLFSRGEPSSELYLLVQGRVEVRDGRERISQLEKAALDVFSIFSNKPHAVTARTLAVSTFLVVSYEDLVDLLTGESEFCWAVVRYLAGRARKLGEDSESENGSVS